MILIDALLILIALNEIIIVGNHILSDRINIVIPEYIIIIAKKLFPMTAIEFPMSD